MPSVFRTYLVIFLVLIPLVRCVVYDINLLIASSEPEEARQLLSIVQLATQEVSIDLGADQLRLNLFEYGNDLSLATKFALESGQNDSVLAVILTGPTGIVDTIAALARWFDLPVLAFDATNTTLPTSAPGATFVSLNTHVSFVNDALSALFAKYSWTRIGVVYRNSPDDACLAHAIEDIPGLRVNFSRMSPDTLDTFLPQFQFIVKLSISVVVLVDSDGKQAGQFLRAAEQANLFTAGRTFIVISQGSRSKISYTPVGTLIMSLDDATLANLTAFTTKIKGLDPNVYPGTGPGSHLYQGNLLAYDAVVLLGQAAKEAGPGAATRQNVLNAMKTRTFYGYSGRITLQPNGFVDLGNCHIFSVLEDNSTTAVMYFDGSLTTYAEPTWPGNVTEAPDDDMTFITLAAVMTIDSLILPSTASFRSAIHYAVDQINRDPSVLPDNIQLSLLLLTNVDASDIIQDTVPLSGYGVAGVVGAIQSANSILVQNVVSRFGIPQLSPSSTNPSLSADDLYPTFMRTCPPDDVQGASIIQLAKIWGWTEISIISSTDSYGSGIASVLTQNAALEGIDILVSVAVVETKQDLSQEMEQLKKADTRILIIAHTDPGLVGREMYKAGFAPAAVIGTDTLLPADLASYWGNPNINVPLSFVNGWIGLLPSGGSGPFFDSYVAQLEANPPRDDPTSLIKTGYFLVVSTIDAMRVFADAIRRVLEAGGIPTHGPTLLSALLGTDIEGLTGRITFDARGNRIGPYDIKNWVNGVQEIPGRFETNRTLNLRNPIIWPDGTTNVPLSSLPRVQEWLKFSSVAGTILSILAGLGMLICILMLIAIFFQRRSKVFISATWEFLVLMLIGATLGFGSVFTWIGYPHPYICALRIWLPPMAFILILAPLLAKTWRLHRIFTLKDWKVAPITLGRLILIACTLILGQIIICVLWISLGTIQPIIKNGTNRSVAYALCGSNKASRTLTYITFGYIGALLVAGAYLAFRVRKLPRDFNESRWIGFAIYNTLLSSAIILIISYTIGDFPVTILILICVCSIVIAGGASCFMMIPKLWELVRHPERRSASQNSSGAAKHDTSIALRTPGNSVHSERVTSIKQDASPRSRFDYSLAPGQMTSSKREGLEKGTKPRPPRLKNMQSDRAEVIEILPINSVLSSDRGQKRPPVAGSSGNSSKARSSKARSSRALSPPNPTEKDPSPQVRGSKSTDTPPSLDSAQASTQSGSSTESSSPSPAEESGK